MFIKNVSLNNVLHLNAAIAHSLKVFVLRDCNLFHNMSVFLFPVNVSDYSYVKLMWFLTIFWHTFKGRITTNVDPILGVRGSKYTIEVGLRWGLQRCWRNATRGSHLYSTPALIFPIIKPLHGVSEFPVTHKMTNPLLFIEQISICYT